MRWMESPWPAMLLVLVVGVWGLGWGLPSSARRDLFLSRDKQTPEFYRQVETARTEYYKQIGENPMAHVGRLARENKQGGGLLTLMSSYSSYLVRSHHGDEQANLVMLSHLNPLKGRWYPHTYAYGGVYVYSLAAYLGALHAAHIIRLVPQAAFYYANPEAIARVYWAARFWSVLGMMLAIVPLFFLAKRLAGSSVAFWASCFFALAPGSIGNAKMAKPHVWAAAWSMAMIYCAVRSKEDRGLRWLMLAAACFGIGLGTTMSQVAFFPFLLWACWTPSLKSTLHRLVVAGIVPVGVFLLSNFYIFAHFQDYKDEMYFLSRYSPFALRPAAIWEFVYGSLRPSWGLVFWILVLASIVYASVQSRDRMMRSLAVVWFIVMIYFSFQVQAQRGLAWSSRLTLALIGMGCMFAAWWIQRYRGKQAAYAICFGLLVVQAVFYDLHFQSDRVPKDNPSLAALWIKDQVPAGAFIGHTQVVPHVTEFPPIEFSRYKLLPLESADFLKNPSARIAVIPDWAGADRQRLLENGFVLTKRFAESPIQRRGFLDPFTTANAVMEIYQRPPSLVR